MARKNSAATADETPETVVENAPAPETVVETATESSAVESALPATFGESLALLQREQAVPVSSEAERLKRKPLLDRIRKHVFAVQQGLPVQAVSADDHAGYQDKRRAVEREMKLISLARGNRDVADLLAERDALKQQVEDLTK